MRPQLRSELRRCVIIMIITFSRKALMVFSSLDLVMLPSAFVASGRRGASRILLRRIWPDRR